MRGVDLWIQSYKGRELVWDGGLEAGDRRWYKSPDGIIPALIVGYHSVHQEPAKHFETRAFWFVKPEWVMLEYCSNDGGWQVRRTRMFGDVDACREFLIWYRLKYARN